MFIKEATRDADGLKPGMERGLGWSPACSTSDSLKPIYKLAHLCYIPVSRDSWPGRDP